MQRELNLKYIIVLFIEHFSFGGFRFWNTQAYTYHWNLGEDAIEDAKINVGMEVVR